MYLSLAPCIGQKKDVVLTTAFLTPSQAICRNLSDMITIEKANGRYSMKVKTSAILPPCS